MPSNHIPLVIALAFSSYKMAALIHDDLAMVDNKDHKTGLTSRSVWNHCSTLNKNINKDLENMLKYQRMHLILLSKWKIGLRLTSFTEKNPSIKLQQLIVSNISNYQKQKSKWPNRKIGHLGYSVLFIIQPQWLIYTFLVKSSKFTQFRFNGFFISLCLRFKPVCLSYIIYLLQLNYTFMADLTGRQLLKASLKF